MTIKKSTITQKVIVKATPNEVYDAFVDPKKHSEFTGSKATGKPTVGVYDLDRDEVRIVDLTTL